MQYSFLFNLNRPVNVQIVESNTSFLDLNKITWNLWWFLPFIKTRHKIMSLYIARGDILRAGIINCSIALLRALLECGYYSREGLIWGNTVVYKWKNNFDCECKLAVLYLTYAFIFIINCAQLTISRRWRAKVWN